MNGPYLTIAQAAFRACVSESLLYEACRKRLIPHYRPGMNGRGKILILPEDVDAWMAAFKVDGGEVDDATPLKHLK